MSEHHANLFWKRQTPDFQYETYNRTHTIRFGGGSSLEASSAPEYKGLAEFVNPEEQFAAALSSCHMLTFLAVAAKRKLVVESYEDRAVALLDKSASGKLCITRITLNPKVTFSGDKVPDHAALLDLHEKAHQNCFIAQSISAAVQINVD